MSTPLYTFRPNLEVCFVTPITTSCAHLMASMDITGGFGAFSDPQVAMTEASKLTGLKFVACDVHRRCTVFYPSYSDVIDKFNFENVLSAALPRTPWQNGVAIFDHNIPAKMASGGLYMFNEEGWFFQIFNGGRASVIQLISPNPEDAAKREFVIEEIRDAAEALFKRDDAYPHKREWIKKNSFRIAKTVEDQICPNPFELFTSTGIDPFTSDPYTEHLSEATSFCYDFLAWGASLPDGSLKECTEGTVVKLNVGKVRFESGGKTLSPLAYYERTIDDIVLGMSMLRYFDFAPEFFARVIAHECEHRKFDKSKVRSEYSMLALDAMNHLKADLLEAGNYFGVVDWFTKWYVYRTVSETYDEELNAYAAGFIEVVSLMPYSVPMIEKRLAAICELMPRDGAIYILNRIAWQISQNSSVDESSRVEVLQLIWQRIDLLSSDS